MANGIGPVKAEYTGGPTEEVLRHSREREAMRAEREAVERATRAEQRIQRMGIKASETAAAFKAAGHEPHARLGIFAGLAALGTLLIWGGAIFAGLGKLLGVIPFPILLGLILVVMVILRGK